MSALSLKIRKFELMNKLTHKYVQKISIFSSDVDVIDRRNEESHGIFGNVHFINWNTSFDFIEIFYFSDLSSDF